MGRKIPLLSLTLAIISPVFRCMSTFATTLPPENERNSWSVIELLNIAGEVNERIKGDCNGDSSCMLSNFENIRSSNDKSAAYLNLRQKRFLISSIDPSNESFRVIYFDDSIVNKLNGVDESEQINHAIFMWFDEWQYQINIHLRDDLFNNDLAGKHILYYSDERKTHNHIIFSNTITEFQLNEGDISGITNGRLDYSVGAGPHFDRSETANYSSCQYESSDECRAMIDASGRVTYTPAAPAETMPSSAVVERFFVTGIPEETDYNDDGYFDTWDDDLYYDPDDGNIAIDDDTYQTDTEVGYWAPEHNDLQEPVDDISTDIQNNATDIIDSEVEETITPKEFATNTSIPSSSRTPLSKIDNETTNDSVEPTVASSVSTISTTKQSETTKDNEKPIEVPVVGEVENSSKSHKSLWWLVALVGICLLPFIWFIIPTKKRKKDEKKSKNL